jgi:hypothetical protein
MFKQRFFAVLAFALVFPCFLAAQDSVESGSHVTKTAEGFRLSQTISFPPVPDALRYDVELEQRSGDQFVPFDTIQTETNSIDVSLRAGSYRYRIFSYNRMNLLDGMSDWQEFEVLAAVEPAMETYRPFYGLYYDMANPSGSLSVAGRDFFPDSEFALLRQEDIDYDWTNVNLEGRKDLIFPNNVTVNEDGTLAVLDFSRKSLRKGNYSIFARNPGGLWSVMGQVRVGFKNNTDYTLSFGFAPMIAAFDYDEETFHDEGEEKPRLDFFNPQGAYLRFGGFPVKTKIGSFGLGTGVFFLFDNMWQNDQQNGYHDDDPWVFFTAIQSLYVNLLYQKPFAREGGLFELRAGAGLVSPYRNELNEMGEKIDVLVLFIEAGAGIQFFIWKNLYIAAGFDIGYTPLKDTSDRLMLWPNIGLGWQFGRWGEAAEVSAAVKRGEDPSVPVTETPKDEATFSLGWSPMIPFFDYNYTEIEYTGPYTYTETEYSDLDAFNPLGAYLRIAFLPHRRGDNKFGFEFAIYVLDHRNRETYDVPYNYIDLLRYVQFAALYQRRLPKDWQLNARLGAGISNPYDHDYVPPPALNLGLSFQRFFWRGFFAEAGFDFVVSFGEKTHWILNPGIGIGWQFNRDTETGLRPK